MVARPAPNAWLDETADAPLTVGVPPSWTDRIVRVVSQRLGGPIGQRADALGRWWSPVRWTLLTTTVVYLLGVVFRLPCRITVAGQSPDHFRWMCYSDIGILYQLRGLMQGNVPYLDTGDYPVLEYPALTGWFLQLLRMISTGLGAPTGTGLTAQQQVDSTLVFLDVNTVVLAGLLLVTVWAQARAVPHRPWDAMMVAASPCVAATALINWDLLPVALTALGVLFWARRRPGWAGVAWGLGMAAKLYPLFLLGPLLLLCLRSDRLREFGRMLAAFAVAWLVANLPAMWLAPEGWRSFWSFNSDRTGDLGSIWYVMSLAGHPVERLNLVSLMIFAAACLAIAALIMIAPRRPRVGQVMFLVIAAFLITNKVYSPQYVLWLLPFVVLARPVWRDWLIFTVGELGYFAAIWWHLGGLLAPGGDGPDKVYWLAVAVRVAAQLWIAAMVVRDIWRPEHDVVRHPPGIAAAFDDPTGGVLDSAPDASWLPGWQLRVRSAGIGVRRRLQLGSGTSSGPPSGRPAGSATGAGSGTATGGVAATPSGGVSRRLVTRAWLASRGLIALVALTLAVVEGWGIPDMIDQWDVEHFTNLALNGYLGRADGTLMAFFPGLPALLRLGVEVGVPIYLSGVIISAVGSYAAALALVRLGGPTAGPVAAVAWLFAPTAVFTVVPYTEALFCAAAFWAWERARAGRWPAAAALAAAACTMRVSGLFLVGALVVLAATMAGSWPDRLKRLPWLLLPGAVLAAFVGYLHSLTGSWTAWYTAQTTGWARAMTPPWESFANTLAATHANPEHPLWPPVFVAEIVSMALGVVVVGWCLGRRLWGEAAWVGVQVLAFSISYWFMSVNRAVLLWFPLWLMVAQLVTWRPEDARARVAHRIAVWAAFAVSTALMLAWSWLYFTGNWAS